MAYFWQNPALQRNEGRSVLDRATARYGITEDWRRAGYILPDGSMLDFSVGSPHPQRVQDHRNVESLLFPKTYEYRNQAMRRFMALTGSIRLMPEGPSFDIIQRPTADQLDRMKQIVEDGGVESIDMRRGEAPEADFSREYQDYNQREWLRDVRGYWSR